MKKSFIIIGLGRFGSNVAKTLVDMNCDVLAVDINEESVQAISHYVHHCVIADASKESVLKELGVGSIDHAVIAIGNNLQATILTLVNLKKLGVPRITVRADEEGHKEVYKLLGASEVIIPEEASAISLANQITSDSILDYYKVSRDFAMVKVIVRKRLDQNLIQLDLRNNYEINIVGIIKKDGDFYIPKGTDTLSVGDIVVVVGMKDKIAKFDQFLNAIV